MGEILFSTKPGDSTKVFTIHSSFHENVAGTIGVHARGGGKYSGASALTSFLIGAGAGTFTGTFTLLKVS